MIIAMTGLPGTGKSTLAKALSQALPALILDKDVVRAALFPAGEIEYSTHQDDFVIQVMLQVADFYVRKDATRHILLDGRPFSKQSQVDTLVAYGRQHGWDLRFIHCVCSDDVARARIERDAAAGQHLAANRDFNLYLRLKAQADPLQVPHLGLDTGRPLPACIQDCLGYLSQPSENLKVENERP
ncbi:MAG: ATP-binding protein [Chloroflexi bacterium]|jgi:predicted kinase|nr:ATP-binding protein [Anaerolineaceae bacterium]NMB88429.1 ATP-binding protein [Chloroflexota bacterium]